MPYNALILEDDPLTRKVLNRYLDSVPQMQIIGICFNALQAIDIIHVYYT